MLPPQPRPYGIGSPQMSGAAQRVSRSDSGCVLCQYVVQRVRAEMLLNGLGQSVPYSNQLPGNNDAYNQLASAWEGAQSSAGVPSLAPGSVSAADSVSAFLEIDSDDSPAYPADTEDDYELEDAPRSSYSALPALPEDQLPSPAHHHHQLTTSDQRDGPTFAEVDAASGLHRRGFFDAIKKGAKGVVGAVKGFLGMGNQPAPQAIAKEGAKPGAKKQKGPRPGPPDVPKYVPHGRPPRSKRSRQIWKTPRERAQDMYEFRPVQARYNGLYDLPRKVQQRAMERFENEQMMEVVFRTVEAICTHNMPREFYQHCYDLMSKYQFVTRSLMWRDRPDSICMHMDLCNDKSYVQSNPHSRLL